jgi:hypothetical protein
VFAGAGFVFALFLARDEEKSPEPPCPGFPAQRQGWCPLDALPASTSWLAWVDAGEVHRRLALIHGDLFQGSPERLASAMGASFLDSLRKVTPDKQEVRVPTLDSLLNYFVSDALQAGLNPAHLPWAKLQKLLLFGFERAAEPRLAALALGTTGSQLEGTPAGTHRGHALYRWNQELHGVEFGLVGVALAGSVEDVHLLADTLEDGPSFRDTPALAIWGDLWTGAPGLMRLLVLAGGLPTNVPLLSGAAAATLMLRWEGSPAVRLTLLDDPDAVGRKRALARKALLQDWFDRLLGSYRLGTRGHLPLEIARLFPSWDLPFDPVPDPVHALVQMVAEGRRVAVSDSTTTLELDGSPGWALHYAWQVAVRSAILDLAAVAVTESTDGRVRTQTRLRWLGEAP